MTRREFGAALGASAALSGAPAGAAPIHIGSRRELFLDREIVREMRGTELRLGTPVYAGRALELDRPWELNFSGYTTVLADGGRLRMYYRGTPMSKDGGTNEVTCVAESSDGIRWTRPALGYYQVEGERSNNVILAQSPPFSHNFTPLLDTRPGVPEGERYKALSGYWKTGLVAYVSGNGLKWRRLGTEPVLAPPKEFSLDSQNIAFWSAHEKRYVLYYRTWKTIGKTKYRWTSRAVSDDFLTFTPSGDMVFEGPPEHLYTNQTSSYFRAPHIYTGICARFMPGRQVLTDEQARAIRVDPKYFKDCSDAVLISSRGGNRYTRTFLEAFLRPGLGIENWVSRSNYPALNLVQTGPRAMSFYVNRNYGQPTAYLGRYEMRLDGLASVHAGYTEGEMVTCPLIFDGGRLELNYSTSAAGAVRVEMQDVEGKPLAGFALADAGELIGDEIDRAYSWKGGADVSAWHGRPVRLRFVLKDADLFAMRFA